MADALPAAVVDPRCKDADGDLVDINIANRQYSVWSVQEGSACNSRRFIVDACVATGDHDPRRHLLRGAYRRMDFDTRLFKGAVLNGSRRTSDFPPVATTGHACDHLRGSFCSRRHR
jgi:hypothetical protein